MPAIILASASPHRQEMMRQLKIPFEAVASSVQEESFHGSPRKLAVRLAAEKARVCACKRKDAMVIAMDTVVTLGKEILGKPQDVSDARRMLQRLSGRSHTVITGVALVYRNQTIRASETTEVVFRKLSKAEIDWYIKTGEPFDKAGAYGIQGFARLFVTRIDGCYYNVIGFPIFRFQQALKRLGFSIFDFMSSK